MDTLTETTKKPRIAVTIGDPAGIGPEVTVKALSLLPDLCAPTLVGSRSIIDDSILRFGLTVPFSIEEVGSLTAPPAFGEVRKEYGAFVWKTIEVAVRMAMEGRVDAIVTAPLCKHSLQLAGCPHSGHTELLAELAGVKRPIMMLANRKMKVVLVTTHVPIRAVPQLITQESVFETIRITVETFKRFEWGNPRLAVLGLNPHAGEDGALGHEDQDEIAPAVTQAKNQGYSCDGPIPADTAFHRALEGEFDVIVAMYHDQGLGPLKTVSFRDTINITLGLPFVRVSPGHGTAFDIAGKGVADPTSMKLALETAAQLGNRRRE